jgi:hypothetical protein
MGGVTATPLSSAEIAVLASKVSRLLKRFDAHTLTTILRHAASRPAVCVRLIGMTTVDSLKTTVL